MASDDEIVFSSFTAPPQARFSGYCFIDAHYIFGDSGRQRFEKQTGRSIGPGSDGCYVSVRKTPDGFEAGVDGAGLAQIFYYIRDGIWAFANSLTLLADHLRSHGVRLAVNFAQLAALGAQTTLTTQLSAFTTMFCDVFLLPSAATLRISSRGLEPSWQQAPAKLPYEAGLGSYLGTWIARVQTLLADGRVNLLADLTGGIDSRTMFAMLSAAASSTSERRLPNFRSGDTERHAKDFAAASRITAAYDIPLNSGVQRPPIREDGHLSFMRWRRVCLGTYLSVYLRRNQRDPFQHHFNGGGGENFRQFYPSESIDEVIASHRARLPEPLFDQWRHEVLESVAVLQKLDGESPSSVLHYREFRNRLHTGRAPHFSVEVTPLSGVQLRTLQMDRASIASRQLYFDIMESLSPGLMLFPYDADDKAPTADNQSRLTVVRPTPPTQPGQVFAPEPEVPNEADVAGGKRAIDHFTSEASRALALEPVRELMSDRARAKADAVLRDLKNTRSLPHASEGKTLSYAMSVAYALDI